MKLIKNCIIIGFISIMLFSCGSNDGLNHNKCIENVKKVFPNSKIYSRYGGTLTFIVIDYFL